MKKKGAISYDSPDKLNVIVQGSKVIGDMITESNLRIDGVVEGNVTTSAKVVIGQTGHIKGNLTCGSADIEGNIDGTLVVEGLLSLRANAIINGEISTSKLQIEEGASFSGNCSMNNRKPVLDPIKEESSEDNMVY
jgi:cytoskeletal protein CcmA (bactofilin family)